MKIIITKVVSMISLMALLFSCVSAIGCEKSESENGNLRADSTNYVVYCDVNYVEALGKENTSSGGIIEQKNLNVFKPGYDSKRSTYQSQDAVLEKAVQINGQELSLKYRHSISQNIVASTNKEVAALGRYDAYQAFNSFEKMTTDVYFRKGSDEVLFYTDYELNRSSEGITEQEAKAKADEIAVSMFGSDTFSKFTYKQTTNGNSQGYIVTYARYVNGYETDETIRIVVNGEGKLCSLKALSLGIFDYVDVTKEQIEAADKVISEKLPDEYYLADKYLTVDSKGDCYLYYCISTGSLSLYEYYINII